jgi:hypothetical protein
MRSERNAVYEKPAIQTVGAAELIEMIGPVQGYGVGAGGGQGPESILTPYNGSGTDFGR